MAKLYFRYGAMGSSKTANALMVHFNYTERGQRALLLKPSVDERDGKSVIRSRIGLTAPCAPVTDFISEQGSRGAWNALKQYDCVIVDEAQFLTPKQVHALATEVADKMGIPVICYGLRTDFQGNLFPGSEALLCLADRIEEIKTICWCGKKATHNARYNENGIVRHGEQLVLGSNDKYTALCRKHFVEGVLSNPNESA